MDIGTKIINARLAAKTRKRKKALKEELVEA